MNFQLPYVLAAVSLYSAFESPSVIAQLPKPIQHAIDKSVVEYTAACEAADEKLLLAFDTAIEAVRKAPRVDPAVRQLAIDSINSEKFAFQKHGTLPFSPAMRQHAARYLTAIETARLTAGKAYNRGIEYYQKSLKDDAMASLVADEKKKVLTPKVIAHWECTGTSFRRTFSWKLNADGTVGDTNDTWKFEGDKLVLRVGTHVDTCTIDGTGRRLQAKNEGGGTYVGNLVDPKIEPEK